MARPERNNVDYFPFICEDGNKMFYIEETYGNDGFATFVKLLRELAKTNYHYLDLSKSTTQMFLSAKCKVSKEVLLSIINDLVELGKFDSVLWNENKIIWCQDFIDSIQDAYVKRNNKCITFEGLLHLLDSLGIRKLSKQTSKGGRNPQSIVEYIKEDKIKSNKITIWLDKNCPTVQKMKEPITYEQAEKLLNDFPTDKEKAILADTFLAMENHSQLLKKYKSANLTVRNWVKNRFDSEPKTQLGKADKWTHPNQVDITDLDFFSKIPKPPPIEDAEAQHQWSCIWKVQQHRQYISDNNL
jgi:hypothetical protein